MNAMKKCLIIINFNAGSSKKISFEKVEKCLGEQYIYARCSFPSDVIPPLSGFNAIAICGGDGTLGSILEKAYKMPIKVYYFPVGTLNDKAKAERYRHAKSSCPSTEKSNSKSIVIGKSQKILSDDGIEYLDCDEHLFSYVLASGAFTPIGYTSSVKEKQKFGILAYICKVIKEYKPHLISATIDCNGKTYTDNYNLIMFLKSPRCFGFKFNKGFDASSQSGHLVAIRSPKHSGFLGKIEMFFPFFRTFFIGLKKERDNGKIIYKKFYSLKLNLHEETTFCKDGEKLIVLPNSYKISYVRTLCDFTVIEKF